MGFPELAPTGRSYEPGNYPVKTFKAQNGAEHRILYGSERSEVKLSLSYANIGDANVGIIHPDASVIDSKSMSMFGEMRKRRRTITMMIMSTSSLQLLPPITQKDSKARSID